MKIIMQAKKTLKHILAVSAVSLLCTQANAGEGGFVGLYGGSAASLDFDKTDTSIKLLVGANITKQLALEFGYMSLGDPAFDEPTAVVPGDTDEAIYFKNASHGSTSLGEVRDGPVPANGTDAAKPQRDPSTFKGAESLSPQGVVINLRYDFNVAQDIDFFLKGGAYGWVADYTEITLEADENGAVTRTEESFEESAVHVLTGGGFIWQPIKQLGIRAEFETVAIDTAVLKRSRFEIFSLGLQYEY